MDADKQSALMDAQRKWLVTRDSAILSAPPSARASVALTQTRARTEWLRNYQAASTVTPVAMTASERPAPKASTSQRLDNPATLDDALRLTEEANQFHLHNNFSKAETRYVRVVKIYEKALGPTHPDTATSLNNLAELYLSTGDYAKAEPLYVRALKIYEKALGPSDPHTATVLTNLGDLYRSTGAYAKAEPLLIRALEIREKAFGPTDPDTSLSLSSLAILYDFTGAKAKAESLYVRVVKIDEKALGPNDPRTALSLNNLADFYLKAGAYAKAEPLLVQSLAIFEKAFGPSDARAGTALASLAKVYQRTGAYAKAEPLLVRALEIYEKVAGPSDRYTANRLGDLADLHLTTGAYAKAEPLYLRALEIREKALGHTHPDTATSLNNLAEVNQRMGEFVKARSFAARYMTVKHQNLQDVLQLDEHRRLAWQNQNLKFDVVTLLEPKQVALWVMRWTGAVLDSIIEDQAAATWIDKTASSKAMGELRELRQSLAATIQRGKEAEPERMALSGKISVIERSLAGNSVALGRVRASANQVLEQAAAALPKNAISVDFFRFTPVTEDSSKAHYGLVILNGAGDVAWADLGEDQVINNAVASFRTALTSSNASVFESAAKSLYEILWKPVQKVIPEGTKGLFICPDGDLNFVPFAALSDSEGKFLSERYAIAFIGSVRDLFREPLKSAGEKTMAIFANPAFSNKVSGAKMEQLAANRAISIREMGNIRLSQLAGAELEGRNVSKIAKESAWKSALLTGTKATEEALMSLHSPGVLHLATHGFFLDGKSEKAGAGGEKERGLSVKPVQTGLEALKESAVPLAVLEEEILGPMRRSGLALAGAQNTFAAWGRGEAPQPNNDGVLTAEEASGLDLQGTWLVTLSACETGVGKTQSGEGVFGLRRAIMMAGAKNLLMTLWPVSDDTTGKIMSDFYAKALSSGKAWESLAEVQRDWLVKLRKEKGLQAAVRDAGPFAMAVMVNPANAGLDGK